jgi:hypothetical protein
MRPLFPGSTHRLQLAIRTSLTTFALFAGAQGYSAGSSGKGTFPTGVVHGPKAAFKINAPKGWVVDNESGVQQGLPCVLYPTNSTWADADAVMYAKIASTDTTDRDAFVKIAIGEDGKGQHVVSP